MPTLLLRAMQQSGERGGSARACAPWKRERPAWRGGTSAVGPCLCYHSCRNGHWRGGRGGGSCPVPACPCGAVCGCPLTASGTAPLWWHVPCLCAAGIELQVPAGGIPLPQPAVGWGPVGGSSVLTAPCTVLPGAMVLPAERGPGRERSRGAAGGRGVWGTYPCISFPPRPLPRPLGPGAGPGS